MTIRERLKSLANPSRRKLALFACSCVRINWQFLDGKSKRLVIAAENYVEGIVNESAVKQVAHEAWGSLPKTIDMAAYDVVNTLFGEDGVAMCARAAAWAIRLNTENVEKQHQLFDDIFGK